MPTLTQAAKRLEKVLSKEIGYNSSNKKEFGSAAKSFLKAWLKANGREDYACAISWNKGGIAVSGEVMFQISGYEIWISKSCTDLPAIMYRSRTPRLVGAIYNIADVHTISNQHTVYATGPNCWATPSEFSLITEKELIEKTSRPSWKAGTKFL